MKMEIIIGNLEWKTMSACPIPIKIEIVLLRINSLKIPPLANFNAEFSHLPGHRGRSIVKPIRQLNFLYGAAELFKCWYEVVEFLLILESAHDWIVSKH